MNDSAYSATARSTFASSPYMGTVVTSAGPTLVQAYSSIDAAQRAIACAESSAWVGAGALSFISARLLDIAQLMSLRAAVEAADAALVAHNQARALMASALCAADGGVGAGLSAGYGGGGGLSGPGLPGYGSGGGGRYGLSGKATS